MRKIFGGLMLCIMAASGLRAQGPSVSDQRIPISKQRRIERIRVDTVMKYVYDTVTHTTVQVPEVRVDTIYFRERTGVCSGIWRGLTCSVAAIAAACEISTLAFNKPCLRIRNISGSDARAEASISFGLPLRLP